MKRVGAYIHKHALLLGVIALLILTNTVTATYLFPARDDEDGSNLYPYIDPARNVTAQEDNIVNIQPLREKVNALADEFGRDSISVYIEYLNTGTNISINPENYIWPASLPKLPLAMAVMKKVEVGTWKLENELVLMQADKDAGSGKEGSALWENPVGTRFTIEKLLEELLVNSDNTAHRILARNMHSDEILDVVNALGIDKLYNKEDKISAKEYSRFFRSLYTASYLSQENSQRILVWLDQSPFDNFLSREIAAGVNFPHKYGENVEERVYADSGIVYLPNRPYLITVLVQGNPDKPLEEEKKYVEEFMGTISKETYGYFSRY